MHTPGPWSVNFRDFAVFQTASQNLIAQLVGPASFDEAEANARLIAGCPTMFEHMSARASEGDVDAATIINAILAQGR